MKISAEKRGFTQGFVYAIAQLIRLQPTSVEEMWRESGLNFNDLKLVDDYDANEVKKYFELDCQPAVEPGVAG